MLSSLVWCAMWMLPMAMGAPRTVKIDAFYFSPGSSPWNRRSLTPSREQWMANLSGSGHRPPLIEQWTTVLSCTPIGKHSESCVFVDGVWYSYVRKGSNKIISYNLTAPGTLLLTWTPRGRLFTWNTEGDRMAFRDDVGKTMLEAYGYAPNVEMTVTTRRAIGERVEDAMIWSLTSTLSWEKPKGNQTAWKTRTIPAAARTYRNSTLGGALDVRATEVFEGVHLDIEGEVKEYLSNGQINNRICLQSQLRASATFDVTLEQVIEGRYETHITTGAFGQTHSILLFAPWVDGDSTEPVQMPVPWLP